jgi:hypothetical protein
MSNLNSEQIEEEEIAMESVLQNDQAIRNHLWHSILLGFDWQKFASATPQLHCANPQPARLSAKSLAHPFR